MPNKTEQQQKETSLKNAPGHGFAMLIGAVVIIFIAGAAYLLFLGHGSNNNPVSVQISDENSQFIHALNSTPGSPTLLKLASTVEARFNRTQQLTVNYTGGVLLNVKTPLYVPLSFDLPLAASMEKYYNNSRIAMNISGIPVIGHLGVVEIALSNATQYDCSNGAGIASAFGSVLSGTNAPSGNGQAGRKVECLGLRGNMPLFNSTLDSLGEGQLNQSSIFGEKFAYVGSYDYRGTLPCDLMQVAGTYNVNSSFLGSAGTAPLESLAGEYNYLIRMCLSENYFIPLNLSVGITPAGNGQMLNQLLLTVNESSLSQSGSLAEISALPGPVMNTSLGGNLGITPGGNITASSGMNATNQS